MEKRRNIANYILMAAILLITTLEWHFAEWYGKFTPYGTLIMFACLSVMLLLYVDLREAFKDPVFIMICVTFIIAVINLFIVRSNKGCILVVANMLIMLYLANKVRFTKTQMLITLCYMAFFFFYWTVDVKGYFKGYNTNYGGLILITGFALLMVVSEYITAYLRVKRELKGWIYAALELFFIALAFNIISWYRSRTALIGLIVLLMLKFLPVKFITNKIVYTLITLFGMLGGVGVSVLYILLGRLKESINLTLFYKDIISGREILWSELWGEFLKMPLTGIGSAYEVKTDFMEGMLEVHNGMLDILIVHGIIVFIPICLLFTKRLIDNRDRVASDKIKKAAFSALIAMMATSFFENFIIVQPFTLVLLVLFAEMNGRNEGEVNI